MQQEEHPTPASHAILVAGVVLFSRDSHILLMKREEGLHAGQWILPNRVNRPGETIQETAKRALLESVWIDVAVPALIQARTYSRPLWGGSYEAVITTTFVARLEQNVADLPPFAPEEKTIARWHSVTDLPDLAFDRRIIDEAALSLFTEAANTPEHAPFEMTRKHLAISLEYLARQTPAFLAALAAYLARPEDPTRLRVYNLRQQAASLSKSFWIIDSLLASLDTQEKK